MVLEDALMALEAAIAAVDRARHLTQQLLSFGNGIEPLVRTVATDELVRQAVTSALRESDCGSEFSFSGSLPEVDVDVGRFLAFAEFGHDGGL